MTLISVVIPAFNEADRIGDCLRETALALQDWDYELIPVDDGSRDATFQAMTAYAARNPRVRPVRQPSNQGKGAAVFLGCQYATGEMVAFLDADKGDLASIMRRSPPDAEDHGRGPDE